MDYLSSKKTILILLVTLIVAVSVPTSIYLFKKGYFDIRQRAAEEEEDDEEPEISMESLVGWWKFEESEAVTGGTAKDSSNQENDGVYRGSESSEGYSEYGREFDGVDDFVEISDIKGSLDTGATETVEAWFKTYDVSNDQAIIMHGLNDVSGKNNVVKIQSGKLHFAVKAQGGVTGVTTLKNDTWYHVAVVCDETNVTIYLNGVPEGNMDATVNLNSSSPVLIGGYENPKDSTYGFPFDGIIDEVRVFDDSKSAEEIKLIYEQWTGGGKPESSCGDGTLDSGEECESGDPEGYFCTWTECDQDFCVCPEEEEIACDLNQDSDVSMSDYSLFVQDYLEYREGGDFEPRSDLNGDDKISMSDYSEFVDCYLENK